ncbi:2-oxoglutarate dehydrogenase complex dihydrolipoyllysine-residue succinyltransferase [Lacipirellula limnantheis]|uniref:Dihydrolipoyllysine-residue succinyltransferase n=1 Tax=Lacipirellula limnantheis TaxID=2528024 RepID=A0A517U2S7_9BACT|nr:2-oxoglutarate dehydrogenase complex dihydrolipoyllysine-residue succinyltransferase [Lacipirellula limnantheis]QDT74935.1 Dihydrolipoyllysine-residue succinyltransferase component of 2-oxoglutarate dehydrogenase complex [Lacipirellula limnantheis]
MSIELKVPVIGESVSEIFIGQWYKGEGSTVAVDENLVELESEKATLDVPSPSAGVITKILKHAGETAEVGEVIAYLDQVSAAAPAAKAPEKAPEPAPAPPVAEAPKPAPTPEPPKPAPAPTPAAKVEPPPSEPAKTPTPMATQPINHTAKPANYAQSLQVGAGNRTEEVVPMSPVRRRIAARLLDATQNAALLTTFNEVDMTAVKELRGSLGEAFEKRYGVRLGFMSFFVKAAVDALKQCPEINAIIEGDKVVYRRYFDVGVAIGSDRGLFVPVLRNAEEMTFADIEKSITDLAKRAQSGNLRVEELQGGTFTITNGGVYGSLLSTPIVNPPQSGVLGMHSIQNRPVAIDGQVVIRPMMYLALTYDHRIVDGREAVTFLKSIKDAIENPARILLEV